MSAGRHKKVKPLSKGTMAIFSDPTTSAPIDVNGDAEQGLVGQGIIRYARVKQIDVSVDSTTAVETTVYFGAFGDRLENVRGNF